MAYYQTQNPNNVSHSQQQAGEARLYNHPSRTQSLQHQHQPNNDRGYLRHLQYGNGNMGGQQATDPGSRARYYPGSNDDYKMMPAVEVVSPLPQRYMPEIPANMQQNLANLELGAGRVGRIERSVSSGAASISTVESFAPIQPASYQRLGQQAPSRNGYTASYEHTNAGQYQNINNRNSNQSSAYDGSYNTPPRSPKKLSIFPKPQNAGPNVPMSDEEKAGVLDRARSKVMNSNDPDMQLAWAQDALQWVEISERDRENDIQSNTTISPSEQQICQDAIEIVKFLSDQGHPKAEFMKGTWMEFGKFNYPIDKKGAFLSYKRAANQETHGRTASGRAEYRMGWLFESTKEMSKAITHYQRGTDMGDSASSYRVGMMTLLGEHGQNKDPRRGLELIRFAADAADENAPQGAYMYGMLLAREIASITVPDDILPISIPLAKSYIEKAAYLGFSKAQLKMGQAYELCQLECEFDPALSLHYNALAAKQGEAESDMAISKWFLCGYEGVFEKNEEQAFVFASRAAQTEMPTAEFAMGYFYEIGIFVPSDMTIAKSWYEKASRHGNQDAASSLERLSSKRFMSRDDHQKVGLNKIKSLHGSQRGGRPDPNRVRRKPPPMQGLPEGAESIPSDRQPVVNSANSASTLSPPLGQGFRSPSVVPYPADDASFSRQQGRGQGLVSPHYRSDVGPSRSPDGRLSAGPQADRPSSAFGVQPMQHSATAPSNANNMGPAAQRPLTAIGNMSMPQNGRPMDQSYGARRPSPSRAPILPQPNLGPQFGTGRPQQGPPTGHPGYPDDSPQQLNSYPSYPNSQNPPQQQQYPARSPGIPNGGGTNIRPPRGSSMQPQSRSGSTPVPQAQQQRPTGSQAPQVGMSSKASAPAAAPPAAVATAAPPAPVKKGPKTFEEMGVHVQKKESECTVM